MAVGGENLNDRCKRFVALCYTSDHSKHTDSDQRILTVVENGDFVFYCESLVVGDVINSDTHNTKYSVDKLS